MAHEGCAAECDAVEGVARSGEGLGRIAIANIGQRASASGDGICNLRRRARGSDSYAGPVIIEPVVHGDERGFFCETYRVQWNAELGIPPDELFVQDNHSRSSRGVVRGMHFHVGSGVAKLVRCARGRILDVAVDLRRGSPTYGQWEGVELDEERMRVLYVPVGFAHGFCVLSDLADVLYKQTAYYDPALERGIAWNDPDVGIQWPLPGEELIVSDRDAQAPRLREIAGELPFQWASLSRCAPVSSACASAPTVTRSRRPSTSTSPTSRWGP